MPPSIERHILEELNRYDPNLRVRWRPVNLVTGTRFERWQITRIDPKGVEQHIMFVIEPDGGYRPVDQRVLEKLRRCDLWRYASIEEAQKALELPADAYEANKMLEAHKKVYGDRYHDWVEEFADRLAVAVRDDPHTAVCDRAVYETQRRLEQTAEASDCYLKGVGIVEVDPEVGGMRVAKGSP